MTYRQITSEQRYMLAALRAQGFCAAEIARVVGCHRSTIGREVARNRTRADGRYRADKAQEMTNGRRSRSRRNQRFSPVEFAKVNELLSERWSPEQISGRLASCGLAISHETIYRHVWRDKKAGGRLFKHLRCAQKKRRKGYGHYDSRGRLAGKRHISERPACVETRNQFGHWEIDTVMGSGDRHCIVTLVERKTGLLMIGKLASRTSQALNARTIQLLNTSSCQFTTITADNGTEFHGYEEIERCTRALFYFSSPYHSWQRGTNENTNGLIRQYLPKGRSMAALTQYRCDGIAHALNTRPRKRLGFKTPLECYRAN